jgi:polysaccharide biosynthesis protein PelF
MRGRRKPTNALAVCSAGDWAAVDVAIVAESTYPYLRGGVSAVMHDIVRSHPDVEFGVIHIGWDSSRELVPHYEVPGNVRWIAPLYLSIQEHREDFMAMDPRSLGIGPRRREELALEVLAAIEAIFADDVAPFWTLYDRYINPRTCELPLWPLLATREWMRLIEQIAPSDVPLARTFWELRNLAAQTYAIASFDYPQARVYHAHTSAYAALAGALAARQNGGRSVLNEHNLYVRDTINERIGRSMALPITRSDWLTFDVTIEERMWMAWLTEMTTVAYDAADEVTYLYPEALAEAAALGAPMSRSRVVPNGIDLDYFETARERQIARDGLRRDQDHTWVLAYVARIVQIKGLLDLLEALAIVVQRGWNCFELRVMGHAEETPEYLAKCKQRAAELGLEGHISLVGPQNLREAFAEVDLIVLPSHNEGQPLAILEAMTAGVPTVGTRVGGMEQLLQDPLEKDGREVGPCGIIVQPHIYEQMADAIMSVTSNQEMYGTFRTNAFERVRHAFQLPDAMRSYRQIYDEVIARDRRKARSSRVDRFGPIPLEQVS